MQEKDQACPQSVITFLCLALNQNLLTPFVSKRSNLSYLFTFSPSSVYANMELQYIHILLHFRGKKRCLPLLATQTQMSMCILPFTPCISSHLCLFILLSELVMCVCVVQCAGREQLEHLQSSPLTAARHMAGPCEGWVLSPGKVLTHRQEH